MSAPTDLSYRMKARAKEVAERAGFDIRFHRDPLRFLQRLNIRSVLDIGANSGQFAKHARSTLPAAKIYSFEPLPGPFAKLLASRAGDGNFECFQVALGTQNGTAEFEENEFAAASSLLKISKRSIDAWPETAHTRKTMVEVRTLDHWALEHNVESPYLVKIDVQGYEDQVIQNGRDTVRNAAAVILEVSFVEVYHGQALFDTLNSSMIDLGFRLHGMIENAYAPATGDILSADAIYLPGVR